MDKQTFVLVSARVRDNALAAVNEAPPGWLVKVTPPLRSDSQNDKMWAMLGDVARAKPEGRHWTTDTWKAAFMHSLGHQVMFAEGLDNSGPFPVGFRSSQLNVKQMIDLITCIYKYGDEHGVDWKETRKGGYFDLQERAA